MLPMARKYTTAAGTKIRMGPSSQKQGKWPPQRLGEEAGRPWGTWALGKAEQEPLRRSL